MEVIVNIVAGLPFLLQYLIHALNALLLLFVRHSLHISVLIHNMGSTKVVSCQSFLVGYEMAGSQSAWKIAGVDAVELCFKK